MWESPSSSGVEPEYKGSTRGSWEAGLSGMAVPSWSLAPMANDAGERLDGDDDGMFGNDDEDRESGLCICIPGPSSSSGRTQISK